MRIFKDSQGQDWTLSVSVGSIKRVRALTEAAGERIDLLRPEEGNPAVVERLVDPFFVCDVAYCLVKPQADALGVTDEQFGERMVGPAIGAAMTALYDELIDFFQSIDRTHLAELLTTHKKIVQAIEREVTSQVLMEQNRIDELSTRTSSSTSSPESSGSTPTPSPSGSSTAWPTPGDSTTGTAPACSPPSSTTAPPAGGA